MGRRRNERERFGKEELVMAVIKHPFWMVYGLFDTRPFLR